MELREKMHGVALHGWLDRAFVTGLEGAAKGSGLEVGDEIMHVGHGNEPLGLNEVLERLKAVQASQSTLRLRVRRKAALEASTRPPSPAEVAVALQRQVGRGGFGIGVCLADWGGRAFVSSIDGEAADSGVAVGDEILHASEAAPSDGGDGGGGSSLGLAVYSQVVATLQASNKESGTMHLRLRRPAAGSDLTVDFNVMLPVVHASVRAPTKPDQEQLAAEGSAAQPGRSSDRPFDLCGLLAAACVCTAESIDLNRALRAEVARLKEAHQLERQRSAALAKELEKARSEAAAAKADLEVAEAQAEEAQAGQRETTVMLRAVRAAEQSNRDKLSRLSLQLAAREEQLKGREGS